MRSGRLPRSWEVDPALQEQDKPYILFFGEKNRLLIYEVVSDKWTLLTMKQYDSGIEFNYFG